MEKQINNGSDLPVVDLEINYNPQTNSVEIIANVNALESLRDYCDDLITKSFGSHYHIDWCYGNIDELLIARR